MRVLFLLPLLALVINAGLTGPAHAQTASGEPSAAESANGAIPAMPLGEALNLFAERTGLQLVYVSEVVAGLETQGAPADLSPDATLENLLRDTGLDYRFLNVRTVTIATPEDLQNQGTAAGQNQIGQRQPGIEEIIVTGQKREERIQDVPIAISAFSMEDLEAQKLEGGFDLVKAIPNVSFTKTNFTSYNFQIRGVGTQATSATTDPGVAVAFNNSAIIQNRLFEQEYLDVERVEVLRGPQGTLYGRNATAGVINVISNKPEMGVWEGMLDVEVGNFNTRRLRGHFNMPIGDTFAIRGAYASTDREGYTFNSGTGNRVDGRDLWTGRLTLGWQPNDRLRADLIWERFEENDNRLRTGKQLCKRDPGPEEVGGVNIEESHTFVPEVYLELKRSLFSQGCSPVSLYSDEAFQTPNGLAIPFIGGAAAIANAGFPIGSDPDATVAQSQGIIRPGVDPYGGMNQSRDLREIQSVRDPVYRAEADLFELNVDFDVTDTLTLSSQTAYVEDETYSFQDFNRFNTVPIFTDTTTLDPSTWGDFTDLAPDGVFCDPQLGCSDRIAGFDIAQASAEQFTQELRLQSSFEGPVNFSIGANYTEFETLVDYYVMFNIITAVAYSPPFNSPAFRDDPLKPFVPGQCSNSNYLPLFPSPDVPTDHPDSFCVHVDPNPVDTSRNFGTGGNGEGEGHNYFRSKNPYELESWAGFGEIYWNIQDNLKLTAGLRYTDDKKTFTPVPTQVLMAKSIYGGGTVSSGYPEEPPIEQQWGEWTGRLVLDWQPVLDFTDETLIYGSFSRGYKGGGANPPQPDFATREEILEIAQGQGIPQPFLDAFDFAFPVLELTAQEYGPTFEPEFVNAYEIGTKNTLFNGAVMLNMTAFYYDYTDYQVSQIRDRTAVNENFDAEMWGLELETVFAPTPNWQFLANVGYLDTKIAEGETSIDIMNRTQGDPDYTLFRPWIQMPSNCVVPAEYAALWLDQNGSFGGWPFVCGGAKGLLPAAFSAAPDDPNFPGAPLDFDNYPELNGGAGLSADLGGNELPQSPNLTVTLGGQYSFDLTSDWRATTRIDYYWQDESYHRIYNLEPYDRLKSWSNTNLSFWVNNANSGITIEAYVKNLFNETPITGAFLNSDDTGLTTNVFMFDPRLIGVSVRKEF